LPLAFVALAMRHAIHSAFAVPHIPSTLWGSGVESSALGKSENVHCFVCVYPARTPRMRWRYLQTLDFGLQASGLRLWSRSRYFHVAFSLSIFTASGSGMKTITELSLWLLSRKLHPQVRCSKRISELLVFQFICWLRHQSQESVFCSRL